MKKEKVIHLKMFLLNKQFNITAVEKGFSKENFEKEWIECDKNDPDAILSPQKGEKYIYYKSLTESFKDMKEELGYSHKEYIETLSVMLARDLEKKEYIVSYHSDGENGEFLHSTFWEKEDGDTLENVIKQELSEIL